MGFAEGCPGVSTDCPTSWQSHSPRQTWTSVTLIERLAQSQATRMRERGSKARRQGKQIQGDVLTSWPDLHEKNIADYFVMRLISRHAAPSHCSWEQSVGKRKEEECVCQFLSVSYPSLVRVHHRECSALPNSGICHITFPKGCRGKPHYILLAAV